MKLGSLSNHSSGDALAAGHTLRALAHQRHPNASVAEVLGRVGEWLVAAASTTKVEPGAMLPLSVRASELLTHSLKDAQDQALDAMSALLAALTHIAITGPKPRHAIAVLIDALEVIRDEHPLPPEASSS